MADAESPDAPFRGTRIGDLAELNTRLADIAASPEDPAAPAEDFWFDMPIDPSLDPLSPAYRDMVLSQYRRLVDSGGAAGAGAEPARTGPGDGQACCPYSTGDGLQVGRWLQAIGFIIATCRVRRGHRVLAIGGGQAGLPVTLAQTGCTVTALSADGVDLDRLRARAGQAGVQLRLLHAGLADALAAVDGQRFDFVMFHGAFHRSADHVALLRLIRDHILAPGGRVVLAGEPLLERLPAAWSLNPAARAILAMRNGGGPSLMFRPSYLLAALSACGYAGSLSLCPQTPLGDVVLGHRIAR